MKKIITRKPAPPVLVKKRATATKGATNEARAKQRRAQMPDYLREDHPELMITEAWPGLLKSQRKPATDGKGMS